MANIFSNPWDEERQRKLRSPFTGVRPYQPSLSPGRAYGQIWDGNTGMGLMPGPSTPPGGPAPLPPNMQTPPTGDYSQNPDPRYRPMIPGNEHQGTINPETGRMFPPGGGPSGEIPRTQQPISPGIPQGPINLPGRGGGYSGEMYAGIDMSGFDGSGPQTMDMVPYTLNGKEYEGSSSLLSQLEEYLNSTGQGDFLTRGWAGRDDRIFKDPKGPPKQGKFSPNPNPPGYITPLPSRPGGPNRPSRPSNPPDYRLARPDPGIGNRPDSGWRLEADPSLLPPLPDMGHIKAVPFQGQGYNRQATSSASPSPAWGVGKTKRKL